ncbi:MAG: ABC transporter ATP-binding protein [Rhodospirillales bacterium]|nr:MAG: ABC transporter ATP-binding protein [Rhodospirillales bacterium]
MFDFPAASASLSLRAVNKTFLQRGQPVEALDNIELEIGKGQFISIVGSSGCGKSTLLRIIAGLETNYRGQVLMNGKPVTGPGLDRGMVFQEHRLLPWLTVEQNVAFGLHGLAEAEISKRVDEHLELVGLSGFKHAYPAQLSGGMAQRVAIARALVNQPSILLLDEPFGALDAMTKIQMQQEVLRIWEAERATMVLVTHDIEEAIYLGDVVVVMSSRPGRIKKIIHVDLPRPRDRSNHHFTNLRQSIFREFFAEEEAPFAYAI